MRIGFWGTLYYDYTKEPQNIIKAPVLVEPAMAKGSGKRRPRFCAEIKSAPEEHRACDLHDWV